MSCLDSFVQGVVGCQIDKKWPIVSQLLAPAIEENEYSLEDVKQSIIAKEMQLWIAVEYGAIKAAMTTKLAVYPQGITCVLMHLGGKWDQPMNGCLDIIGEWAKEHGADRFVLYGRKGWKRVLSGFEEKAIVLEKRI